MHRKINSISVISSASCNLNCSFCYLHKNKSYKQFDALVKEAWSNGSYITNLVKTIKGLNGNVEDIKCIQLWGGETLLALDNIIPNIKGFYTNFPNIEEWKFSTNLLINIDKLFDLILEIEKEAKKNARIMMQISIDGPPGPFCEVGHNGDWKIYRANINYLLNKINTTRLRKIKLDLVINATVPKDLYFKFLDYQEMVDYVRYMSDFMKEIDDQCISGAVNVLSIEVFPTYALPAEDTAEDGVKMLAIAKLWDQVRENEFPEFDKFFGFYRGTGDTHVEDIVFINNVECSELRNSFTVNYDGSICECSGSFIENFEPYLQELLDNNDIKEYQKSKIRNHVVYNPGTATEKEKEYYEWVVHTGYKDTQLTYLHLMMAEAVELAKSGQIDPIYLYDKTLLLRHLISFSNINACSRQNIADTHIPYLVSVGSLRRYLNGLINYGFNESLTGERIKLQKFLKGECDKC